VTSGGGLAGIDVADDDEGNVNLRKAKKRVEEEIMETERRKKEGQAWKRSQSATAKSRIPYPWAWLLTGVGAAGR